MQVCQDSDVLCLAHQCVGIGTAACVRRVLAKLQTQVNHSVRMVAFQMYPAVTSLSMNATHALAIKQNLAVAFIGGESLSIVRRKPANCFLVTEWS